MNRASHITVRASAPIAVFTAVRLTEERRKCSASTMLTSAMSSSGYASDSAVEATLGPSNLAAWASARLQDSVSSEPPISQASSARQTQPALVTGLLASTRSPTMAGGAKHRKNRSAKLKRGTVCSSTTSYHPQTPLPSAAIVEESENSNQAGRKRTRRFRA